MPTVFLTVRLCGNHIAPYFGRILARSFVAENALHSNSARIELSADEIVWEAGHEPPNLPKLVLYGTYVFHALAIY